MIELSILDWLVLGGFFLMLAGVVYFSMRSKEEDTTDYFLAGRNATWLTIGASIFASNIGSEHLVGLSGAGASSGMALAHWELQSYIILMLGWFFVPFYWSSKVYTMPEFLERRFSERSRTFLAGISIVSYVLTKVAVTVYAGALVLQTLLGIDTVWGIDFFWVAAIGMVVVTGIYTVLGGMKAIMWTSVLQTPVLLIGSIIILWVGLDKVGGWAEVERINAENMHLIRPWDDPNFPWPGIIFGSFIIGFWYWCTDQYIVQRVLSAKGIKEARRGTIFAGYLKLLPVFIFLVPGMIAFALQEKGLINYGSSDAAFATLVSELLPTGVKGIVIGGLLAALMSSLASLFNSSATLFTIDFYKKFHPQASEKHLLHVGRMATIGIVVLGMLWIPLMLTLSANLFEYLQQVQALIAPGIAAVFLLGICSKRITESAGFWGLVIGFILGMVRLVLSFFAESVKDIPVIGWYANENWLYICIFLFILIAVLMVVLSFVTPQKDEQALKGLTFSTMDVEQVKEIKAGIDKWDIIHTAGIIALTVFIYWRFF
ncbi:sodium:solute symporter family protein [Catenovulum agarivorans DS-2]|uniref:Sodium:solute symporter family protein n=1 Tax=Catenovulum agarivorans DS-2 TaxID=1328313 RepID=W7QAH4_9ALTE|nr:sodium:solute symporter [Catenovulum agarivorans]EWH09809.1 sodium:solute symporter family protein [Catenovulum agarivorans DS-2]